MKIRHANFAAGEHPFVITARGIEVSFYPAVKAEPELSLERVSIGIPQLDQMLEGGLLRCSTTLISGLPGTAKSTVSASFLAAGLERGERCLLDAHAPTLVVIDPVSAFEKAGGTAVAQLVVERLTWLVKKRGIAAVFTAVANADLGEIESTASQVSAIADTWMHLSFAVRGGERNRTLTIVKSRGTAHSNQLREMILSSSGITLQDVYQIQGDFLLGTARLEREQEQKRAMQAHEVTAKTMLRELDGRRTAALAKLRDAERELLDVNERMLAGIQDTASLDALVLHDRSEVDASRGALDG